MSDFEKKLSESLKAVGESFRPQDVVEKQRIFLHRRRRRRTFFFGSSLALGAAAVAAVLFVTSPTTTSPVVEDNNQPPASETHPVITDVIPVGEGPSGIDVGPSGVWVANTDDGTVSQIDPTSGEVVETVATEPEGRGAPDDVVVGSHDVWVCDSENGEVVDIDPAKGTTHTSKQLGGFSDPESGLYVDTGHIDLALERGQVDLLWPAAEESRKLQPVEGAQRLQGFLAPNVELPAAMSDIAIDGLDIWLLSGREGMLYSSKLGNTPTPFAAVDPTESQDLAVDDSNVWVAQGDTGEVVRIDRKTRDVTATVDVGGHYAGIAIGEGFVWVFTGNGTDRGWVTRIDPDSGKVVGDRIEVSGKPADIAVGAGAVWVTQSNANTVTRIELQSTEAPTPDDQTIPTPDTSPTPDASADVSEGDASKYPFFVYGQDGDIYGQLHDKSVNITKSPAVELNPTISPDGRYVAFERRDKYEGYPAIVMVDMKTGDECCYFPGEHPALGPHDTIAWFTESDAGVPMIGTARTGTEKQQFYALGEAGEKWKVSNISWSTDGGSLFFIDELTGELFVAEVGVTAEGDPYFKPNDPISSVTPEDEADGGAYLAADGGTSLSVIHACCKTSDSPSFSTYELGTVDPAAPGRPFTSVMPLSKEQTGIGVEETPLALAHAPNLSLDSSTNDLRWSRSQDEGWFAGANGDSMAFLRVGEFAFYLPGSVDGGFDARG
jgi:hypothetical protein